MEPPPHTHTREDESFYLLGGEVDYFVGGQVLHAKKGDWVFLPKNIQHSFKVQTEKAEVLISLNSDLLDLWITGFKKNPTI